MALSQKKILHILDRIPANSGTISIVQAKYVDKIEIEGNTINIFLNIPAYANHVKGQMMSVIDQQIRKLDENAEVNIHYGTKDSGEDPLPQVKNVIAIASGKGGVGKSTVAANVALGLMKKGAKVGLLDADFYGPSMPTMFGLQGQEPKVKSVYGKHKIVPLQKHGLQIMSIGLVVDPEQAVVLRGPRLAGLMKQFVYDTSWEELDYLIIDLPPGTGDIQLTLVQTLPLTGAVIVSTPQEVSVVDAVKAMNMFRLENINIPILGIVENMSWFTPKELPENKYKIFGEGGGKKLAKKANTVLLGQLPLIQSVRQDSDEGIPPVLNEDHEIRPYFDKLTENLMRNIAMRNESIEPSKIVKTS